MTVVPLSRDPGGPQSFKQILPVGRLVLGDQDLVLTSGEVAEFDTRLPH